MSGERAKAWELSIFPFDRGCFKVFLLFSLPLMRTLRQSCNWTPMRILRVKAGRQDRHKSGGQIG